MAGSAVRGVAVSRPGWPVGSGGSLPWNSSSNSFSPGRNPVKRIAMLSAGTGPLSGATVNPVSRIIWRARSTIRTGGPMSSTKMPPWL